MRYRVTFLNDNGWAIDHETVDADHRGEALRRCPREHPMGRYGRVSVDPESSFGSPTKRPTFDRSTGRYSWPERQEG